MKRRMGSRRSFLKEHGEDQTSHKEISESVEDLTHQLEQIKNGCHPEITKYSRKVELWLSDQKEKIQVLHDNRVSHT